MSSNGWFLHVDGSPYGFGTTGVAAISSWDDAASTPSGVVVLQDFLAPLDFEITELMHGPDGALDWASCAFKVADRVVSTGPAAGYRALSWLCTRDAALIPQTVLSADLSSTETTTIHVFDASGFAASGTVWIGQEAIDFSGKTATTLTGLTRGRLGSRAVEHLTDADASYYPIVWAAPPGLDGRRCVLWRVDAGAATRWWAGVLRNTPELADDGVGYVLQAVSAWDAHRDTPLGNPAAMTKTRGFTGGACGLRVSHENLAYQLDAAGRHDLSPYQNIADTANDAFQLSLDDAQRTLAAAGRSAQLTLNVSAAGAGFRLQATANGYGNAIEATIRAGSAENSDTFRPIGADPRSATAELREVPNSLVSVNPFGPNLIPVTSTTLLPTTWGVTPYSNPPYSTTVQAVLRGQYGDTPITVYPTAINTDASGGSAPLTVLGTVQIGDPPAPGAPPPVGGLYLEGQVGLRLATRLVGGHWVYVLQHAIEDTAVLKSGIDPRDFDWSLADQLAGVTAGPTNAIDLIVDGAQKLRDVALPLLSLGGCGFGVRGGKIAPVPYRYAVDSDGYAATLTSRDLVAGEKPTYTENRDGIVTSVEVTKDGDTLLVNDQGALARFGRNRPPLQIKLDGTNLTAAPTPNALMALILSRIVGLWGDRVGVVTLPVTWSFGKGLGAGDFVKVSEYLLPDQAGGRGLGNATALAALSATDQRVFIIGRTLRPASSSIVLHGLIFKRATGWSPCVRVASIDGTRTVLTVATGYSAGTATDYAGSNLASYRYASTSPNDGGTAWLAVGDRVQAIVRDSTTLTTESSIVTAVNPASKQVTVSPAFSAGMATSIATGTVDLRYNKFQTAGFQTTQQAFAAVADNASLTIGGTGAAAKKFAP